MTLDHLKSEIGKLPPHERVALTAWLVEQDEQAWDEQIASDARAGKLDALIRRADREHADGTLREAP
jgi:hypothetical protein